jgi:hypothetical protein
VLVLCQEALAPLTLVSARAIGLMTMIDGGKSDHKILAVAVDDPEFNSFREASELPPHRLMMLRRFFQDYKQLEGKSVEVDEFQPAAKALPIIEDSLQRTVSIGSAGSTERIPAPRTTSLTVAASILPPALGAVSDPHDWTEGLQRFAIVPKGTRMPVPFRRRVPVAENRCKSRQKHDFGQWLAASAPAPRGVTSSSSRKHRQRLACSMRRMTGWRRSAMRWITSPRPV